MVLTTDSILEVKGKVSEKPEVNDPDKPVVPKETPARIKIVQKYKRGPGGGVVPESHVYVTFNMIGQGRGGRIKVPRTWMDTLWKSLQ